MKRILSHLGYLAESGRPEGGEAPDELSERHFAADDESDEPKRSSAAAGRGRAVVTLADRSYSSVSNFAAGVVVARGAGWCWPPCTDQ